MHRYTSLVFVALLTAGTAVGQSVDYSPYGSEGMNATHVFWGDTHLHSNLSTDAFGFGVSLGPDEAFRFAAGETVTSTHGQQARLGRPLDFVVLSDHAESMGMMELVRAGDPRLTADAEVADWYQAMNGTVEEVADLQRMFLSEKGRHAAFRKLGELGTPAMALDIWQQTLAIAEQHNKPGVFSTLLGYEWTLMPGGSNLHRVVIFRDDADRVGRLPPLSSHESREPRDLWGYLAAYEEETDGRVLAIPHNGNLSNGLMFPVADGEGNPLSTGDLQLRARWEPVVEVTQIKGDGETHPLLSPDDEFANYETWDHGNFAGIPKTENMLRFEYARSALRTGLQLEQQQGVNPYRFGMIGSTDSHTALATAEEDNFFGKHSGVEPSPTRLKRPVGKAGDMVVSGWEQASSGYAAVWATENTREGIWDALKRREVYASTGPRITLRVFGGWSFGEADIHAPDIARIGYARGVPMGASLGVRNGEAPSFLISALRDPVGANLDRLQVIKGWVDADGESDEKVYDVAWSGDRRPNDEGQLPGVGNTVDISSASWSNSIGAHSLTTVWKDPDFDPSQRAFYYVRVLEIPTPRWSAYDAARFDVEAPDVPMITQERAYSSPIWYAPTE